MKIAISKDFEKNKYWIIALYLNITLITRFVASAYSIIARSTFKFSSILQWVLILPWLIYFFAHVLSKGVKIRQLLVFVVWGFLMVYTFFVTRPRDFLMRQAFVEGISHIVIPAIMIQEVTEADKMFDALEKYVGVCTVTCILQFFSPSLMRNAYYSFSYLTFIPSAICFAHVLQGRFSRHLIPLIIMAVANLLYGGRGFFLCMAVFLLIYSFTYFKSNKNVLAIVTLLAISILVFSLFGDAIISLITGIGISSRTISFATGELNDNSRIHIWTSLLSEFIKEPLKIRGLLSDREYLAIVFQRYSEQAIAGWYSHNFAVEILFEFGIVGVFILLFAFRKYFGINKELKKRKNEKEIVLFYIVSAFFFAKMSISSSYLIDLTTGIIIGFMIAYKSNILYTEKYYSRTNTLSDNNAIRSESER